MWLINARTLRLEYFEGSQIPSYAILSHRWEDGEVSYKEMQKQRFNEQNMKGRGKIEACCRQALLDDLDYVWIDTCCIDKRSSAELSEAINSMFRWYRNSEKCYAFLADIKSEDFNSVSKSFTESQWFTRGWKLQELLAPDDLHFFDCNWRWIESKLATVSVLSKRTGIETDALVYFDPTRYCVAQKNAMGCRS